MKDNFSCFVAMGYGQKKILGTNIDLDLDLIYFKLLKPVLVKKKLKSIYLDDNFRGDEIPTTESINNIFLKSLYHSDFVIADISTLNQNAIYELGLRHAMKPKSTIILCDSKTFNSYSFFDITMLPKFQYDYDRILKDNEYLNKLQCKLSEIIDTCISSDNTYVDSPVFDLDLYEIKPKKLMQHKKNQIVDKSLRELLNEGNYFYENKNFERAEKCFESILKKSKDLNIFSKFIVSKYKKDLSIFNLIKTERYLEDNIDLDVITNENILGNAAAINKNLFALTGDTKYYKKSLNYYYRGTNYESGNLYCARNYCAMLLKKYLVSKNIEEIKEYFYTAKHNSKIFITRSRNSKKEYTNIDDNWYNSNLEELYFIASGSREHFKDIKCITTRQNDTIKEGRKELISDYDSTYSIIV